MELVGKKALAPLILSLREILSMEEEHVMMDMHHFCQLQQLRTFKYKVGNFLEQLWYLRQRKNQAAQTFSHYQMQLQNIQANQTFAFVQMQELQIINHSGLLALSEAYALLISRQMQLRQGFTVVKLEELFQKPSDLLDQYWTDLMIQLLERLLTYFKRKFHLRNGKKLNSLQKPWENQCSIDVKFSLE